MAFASNLKSSFIVKQYEKPIETLQEMLDRCTESLNSTVRFIWMSIQYFLFALSSRGFEVHLDEPSYFYIAEFNIGGELGQGILERSLEVGLYAAR